MRTTILLAMAMTGCASQPFDPEAEALATDLLDLHFGAQHAAELEGGPGEHVELTIDETTYPATDQGAVHVVFDETDEAGFRIWEVEEVFEQVAWAGGRVFDGQSAGVNRMPLNEAPEGAVQTFEVDGTVSTDGAPFDFTLEGQVFETEVTVGFHVDGDIGGQPVDFDYGVAEIEPPGTGCRGACG